ncbi:hypothetical protein IQ268_10640 [Oculatella sp. LEGE 06141]|uniref:hypothetical protein n=1 Tax=Oculatella sp. LEGE 06141 TaxID=1828648 RepID=UPI00188013FA|nr:hypothetical protein [Oculatella sp. LEGE 06141]MBE9179017.1 hypothetical protein [Oculatella sp. LEGE 06141]
MTTQSLNPKHLLRDCFVICKPIYIPLLILSLPGLILSLTNRLFIEAPLLQNGISLAYSILIVPLFAGAAILYIYRYFVQQKIGLVQSLQAMFPKLAQLSLGVILLLLILIPGFVFLVIPGIYLSVRFGFALYAIALENDSAIGGLSRSWELVKGRWWSVFWAELAGSLTFLIPIGLIGLVIGTTLGENAAVSQNLGAVLGFLVSPFVSVYFVLLYLRLRAIEDASSTDAAA